MHTSPDPSFDRRGFLRLTGAAALGASLGGLGETRIAWAQEAGAAQVALVGFPNGADADAIATRLAEAVAAVTDLAWLKPGQRVAIKVVSDSGRPYPFTTHPVALQALIRLLRGRGAQVVVADQAGLEWVLPPQAPTQDPAPAAPGALAPERVQRLWQGLRPGTTSGLAALEANGLAAAAREVEAELVSFDRDGDWQAHPPTPHWAQGFRIPRLYEQVDHVVHLARPSGDVTRAHAGPIESWSGWLHPVDRARASADPTRWPGRMAEVAAALREKTRLTVVAAIDTCPGLGPDWGIEPLAQSSIMASVDQVAIDAAHAALVAWEQARRPRTRGAGEGERFWGALEAAGDALPGVTALRDLDVGQGGVWQLAQERQALAAGLGTREVQIATAGELQPAFLAGVAGLTKASTRPVRPRGGMNGLGQQNGE